MDSWQGVIDWGVPHPSYVSCFQQVTGHPWADAIAANRAQKAGWKTTVLLESNITDAQANSVLAAHNLVKDSDVRSVNGFINTQTRNCTEFQDNRMQAREALTFPGKDKSTPGVTAVLEICGNPVGKPGIAVHKVILPPGTTTATPPPPPVKTGPPPSSVTPPQVKICYKAAPGCGPNGVNAPSVQSGNPGGTPNYVPGTAEKVTSAQQAPVTNPYVPNPVYGSNPPAGSVSPSGADNGVPSGTSGGVIAPSGTPNPTGATAQPSIAPTGTTSGSTGNLCEDPNALGCSH